MSNNDFIYDLSITSLKDPSKKTDDQKKQYMKNLLTDFAQKKNEEALKNNKGEDVYLNITYKYAKYLRSQGEKEKATIILNWIVENKDILIDLKVKDLYLIGSAQHLLNQNFKVDSIQDIENKCCNDYQIFNYYQDHKKNKELHQFIEEIAIEVRNDKKMIKNIDFLEKIFDAVIKKASADNFENVFLFFRLYFSRLLTKKKLSQKDQKEKIEKLLESFSPKFAELLDADIKSDLHKEISDFFKFYDSDISNYKNINELNIDLLEELDKAVEKMNKKIVYTEHTNPEVNAYVKFRYGLQMYKADQKNSEIFFSAASAQNYFKAMYFLSETVKHSDQKEALDLYDKIIKYEIGKNESESKNLNEKSDRFERACALYQKGIVYAEGLYSKNIDWAIVDQCWGNKETDLCITKLDALQKSKYISTKYLNLQFVKYKANHGLLEAKHMYLDICKKENLTNDNDILVIYMHELCLFSNYDKKYIDEMKEYARRLSTGEGVEKDKKSAKMIYDRIREMNNK